MVVDLKINRGVLNELGWVKKTEARNIPSASDCGRHSGHRLSKPKRSGDCIEGCGVAAIPHMNRTLRYDFRYAAITQGATS